MARTTPTYITETDMFRSFLLLAPACAIALPLVPLASDDDLPDVASAPRRRETPIEQIAGSVTIITRDQIERRGWRTLTDALNEVPGLQVVQAGGLGSQTSLFMRGTESNHTLVLLDGIEISDPSNPGGVFEPALCVVLLKDEAALRSLQRVSGQWAVPPRDALQ